MRKQSRFVLISLFVLLATLAGLNLTAQDEGSSGTDSSKKSYATKEEFQKAVREEVAKNMKRLGKGELVGLSKELLQKEEILRVRELQVQKREEEHKINQQDFKNKIAKFNQRQNQFLGCLDEQDKKVSDRISHMVDVVGGMRPQSAADVLSVQEPDISIRILGMLDAERVSKIFNLMDKEVSARLQKQYMNMKR